MKILVTGGAGFIGTNLIKRLVKEGHKVSSIDNYDSGLVSNHQNGVIYKDDDITNVHRMPRDFDKIFHLAALSRIQPSFNNPSETFRVNALGTQHVLDFARNIGAKVVYAGSSSRWHDPYQSPYAAYKHIGEEVCKMYKKTYGTDVEIARFYNVYGPGEIVHGDWAAVGMNYSINEVYSMFRERFGCNCVNIPDQPGNYRETLRENNDTVERLNWQPQDRLQEYIFSLGK